ncbi:metal ABC transporter ATP-binding protein [Janibacter sp. GXQ6167]|uniref:metal ABC transporter ATP-binding protein n=1 Tax=Janibacter sp. GXQ6167 TaxID=3240791 RepID=UPI00352647C3
MSEPVVIMRSAAFGYGERIVVSGVDLTIAPGEVVAVLGPNGSGKSTLVKGLLGLSDQLGGEVALFGTPLRRFHERTRIGYVPQRQSLGSAVRATASEIVASGLVASTPWWAPWRAFSADHRERVRDALAVVGLADHATQDVTTLSGGQQRRVLIARALAAGPEAFILDEPTAGVDIGNQQVLAEVLKRLAEGGATMLIVTHELAALSGLISRAVVVRGGRVIYDGDPAGALEAQASEGVS